MARHADQTRPVVTLRMHPVLIALLDKRCEADRRSRSEMIEMAVEQFLGSGPTRNAAKKKGK